MIGLLLSFYYDGALLVNQSSFSIKSIDDENILLMRNSPPNYVLNDLGENLV